MTSRNMPEQVIAVDPNMSDEGVGASSGASEYSTQSLASSIFEYRYENGRRYHAYADGKYVLPNDEAEQDRLDIVHHICLLLLGGKLHLAPIGPDPQNILDIGTGTGIWAIDAGERYPSARVIGTDLSPIQPSWVPPNVEFQIDDAESPWTWPKNTFDLIHMRHLSGAIRDWPALLKQAFKHLKPGGYIALHEYDLDFYSDDGTYNSETYMWRYYKLLNKAATQGGREFNMGPKLGPMLEDTGFGNIHYEIIKCPFGTWPADKKQKEIGAFFLLTAENAFEAFGLALLTRELGMPADEVNTLIEKVKRDAKSRRIHCYAKQHIYYAQKPEVP